MSWFRKKIDAPSGQTVELDGIQTWTVRWTSKIGDYPYTVRRQEVQAFTNQEDAEHFAKSLREAFKLLRHTAERNVDVESQS